MREREREKKKYSESASVCKRDYRSEYVCVCYRQRESYRVKCRFALVFESSSACSTLFYGVSTSSEGHVTLNGYFVPLPLPSKTLLLQYQIFIKVNSDFQ